MALFSTLFTLLVFGVAGSATAWIGFHIRRRWSHAAALASSFAAVLAFTALTTVRVWRSRNLLGVNTAQAETLGIVQVFLPLWIAAVAAAAFVAWRASRENSSGFGAAVALRAGLASIAGVVLVSLGVVALDVAGYGR